MTLTRDGQVFNLLVSVGPLLGTQSERIGSVIALIDITDHKRAEEVLSRALNERLKLQSELQLQNAALQQAHQDLGVSRSKYYDLYEHAPVGYITLDVSRVIVEANLAAANLLDVPKRDLVAQPLMRFIAAEDQDLHSLCQRQLVATRAPQAYELRMVRHDGALRWVRIESKVEQHSDTLVFLVTLADITERKQRDRELEAAVTMSAALREQTERYAAAVTQAYDATLEGWAHALELRDQETEGHTRRVADLTLTLARALGIPEVELEHIRRGALLHDIGKMGVPDSILLKPGPLDECEWAIMRRHPEYARTFLSPITYLQPSLDIPYCHHEKWDGTGYPRGLKGEEIPLAARLFAVVDVWDALCSDRPYRRAWTRAQAREYLQAQSGKHFEPRIVAVFLQICGEEA